MSNADKRTVATDALATLGTIITDKEKRDAIHLAVEPVVAGERLRAGEHIVVSEGIAMGTEDEGLGIVDPFLPKPVQKGQRFWFIMLPGRVHSLRHVWTHPAFPDTDVTTINIANIPPFVKSDAAKESARLWIEDYAKQLGLKFDELVEGANDWLDHNGYLVKGGQLEGTYTEPAFWDHFSIFTGRTVASSDRENFFSCNC